MKKKQNHDVLSLFLDFKKNVLESKPSSNTMFEELQLMRFKIKPVQGDVSLLNLRDKELIEALWNLGKLDEFFQLQYKGLSAPARKTFFQLFDDLHQTYQNKLNKLNILRPVSGDDLDTDPAIEMEIYKEELPKKYN